ncbi:malonyl-[acyl-carrier protein] O-methyltransferase BioC [Chimaeribacter arupi]|nr:malonyl-[acyl-carrier protein] O-methyltransferase BioC [Chimaeribacter arupi]
MISRPFWRHCMLSVADHPTTVDKRAVAAAFSRAAHHYDEAAALQRRVGERLMALAAVPAGATVLDAGCGTGHFSRRWRDAGHPVVALDLAEGMVQQAQALASADRYLTGDIEALPLPDAAVDAVFSSLVVQWCDALPQVLAELYRVTRPGGVIMFSTLAAGSLSELSEAWQQIDGHGHVNRFLTKEQIAAACAPYRHELGFGHERERFADVMERMRSLKGIGATHLHQGRAPGLTGRRRLDRLEQVFPRRDGQCPLSYHVAYGVIYRD